jgi:serine/threonine protein kinase
MDDNRLLPPGFVEEALGEFDLLELLGAGTFGETYHAIKAGDEYALKVCHFLPVMPDSLWEREIRALRRVSHANVVRFRTAGVIHSPARRYPYMECEYIAGGDIGRLIEAGVRPRGEELRALLVGLLRGIRELHDLGILHRDIKPGNVALRGGDPAQPVLLDFGLAKVFHVSPAHQRLPLSARRSDVTAVAAVVYEAATGDDARHAFARRSRLRPSKERGVPYDPSAAPALADDVGDLVHRLLAGKGRRMGADDALRYLGEA